MVHLLGVALFGARPAQLGNLGFERQHFFRPLVGVFDTGQRQHGAKIDLVRLADLHDAGLIEQIEVAVGQAQTGGFDVDAVGGGVFVVDADTKVEHAAGGQARRAHDAGNLPGGLQLGDFGEVGFDRLKAAVFDGLGVHPGVVEIAQLFFFRRKLVDGLRFQRADDLLHALFAEDRESLERTGRRTVGRNYGLFGPGAIHEQIEVVARLHGAVHPAEVNTPSAKRGFGTGRRRRRWRGGRNGTAGYQERGRDEKAAMHAKAPMKQPVKMRTGQVGAQVTVLRPIDLIGLRIKVNGGAAD